MKALAMFISLAFLYADRSFPRSLADSADKSLSINTDEKFGLALSFLLFSKTQSQSILDRKRTITGLGRGGRDSSYAAPVEAFEDAIFAIRWIAWNIILPGSAPSSFRMSVTFLLHSTMLSPGFSGMLYTRRFSRLL